MFVGMTDEDRVAARKEIGERIRELREKRKLSREALAEMTDLSSASIVNYESGDREPKASDLKRLASALATSVAYLVGEMPPDAKPLEEFRLRTSGPVSREDVLSLQKELEDIEREVELMRKARELRERINKKP